MAKMISAHAGNHKRGAAKTIYRRRLVFGRRLQTIRFAAQGDERVKPKHFQAAVRPLRAAPPRMSAVQTALRTAPKGLRLAQSSSRLAQSSLRGGHRRSLHGAK